MAKVTVHVVRERYSVAVTGGTLIVHDLSDGEPAPDAPVVVLVHGITANALAWTRVAQAIGDRLGAGQVRILAPDLRGRADSRDVLEPAGLGAHAADLNDLICAFGAKPLLVGHSMGAFVTALAASSFPERIRGVVLLDGGLPLPLPDGMSAEEAINAVLGPAMARLSMTFPDQDAYLDFWAAHPAVGPLLRSPFAESVRGYLLHDLVEGDDGLISSCREEVVRSDGRDIMADNAVAQAVSASIALGIPADLIWAQRDLMNRSPGLYSSESLAAMDLPAALRLRAVDADHYDLLFVDSGVDAIVETVAAQLATS